MIIPVYNAEPYLCRCIDSVLASSYADYEILLVNDGSTDKSPEICTRYAAGDDRIRFITQKNQGVSAARNRGIEEAKGTWIIFLDADDFITDDFLEMVMQPAYQELDLILFLFVPYASSGAVQSNLSFRYQKEEMEQLRNRILVPCPLDGTSGEREILDFRTPCARAYKRSILNRYAIRFSPEIKIGEDLLFNLEYQLKANSCVYIPRTVYFYDIHEDSSSHHFNPGLHKNHARLLQAVRDVLKKSNYFDSLEPYFYSYALENLSFVLIREIFSPLSPRKYRENRRLCQEMHQNPLYHEAMNYNGKSGILPRRILLFFFRLRCYPLVKLISRVSYVYLERK